MVHLKGKVDAIVMSAGVGENSPPVRKLLLADLQVTSVAPFSCCHVLLLSANLPSDITSAILRIISVRFTEFSGMAALLTHYGLI